jgi:molybdopterin synthase sulfur carrier subunit
MIRVRVEIGFSFKRELAGDYRELVVPSGADVALALRALVDRFPAIEGRIFGRLGEVRRDVGVLVNGGNVLRRDGLRTELADGDRLTLLPPVGGG